MCEACDRRRALEGGPIGAPCDICNDTGIDYLGRLCRHCGGTLVLDSDSRSAYDSGMTTEKLSGLEMLAKLDRIAESHPVKAVREGAKRDADRFRNESAKS